MLTVLFIKVFVEYNIMEEKVQHHAAFKLKNYKKLTVFLRIIKSIEKQNLL